MSVEALKGLDSSIVERTKHLPSDVKALIYESLAAVLNAYLDTVEKNSQKIAAQDKAENLAKQKAKRAAAIQEEAVSDGEISSSGKKATVGSSAGENVNTSSLAGSGSIV